MSRRSFSMNGLTSSRRAECANRSKIAHADLLLHPAALGLEGVDRVDEHAVEVDLGPCEEASR